MKAKELLGMIGEDVEIPKGEDLETLAKDPEIRRAIFDLTDRMGWAGSRPQIHELIDMVIDAQYAEMEHEQD